jgi:hypothetical protein
VKYSLPALLPGAAWNRLIGLAEQTEPESRSREDSVAS